jgi:hypothetical protein
LPFKGGTPPSQGLHDFLASSHVVFFMILSLPKSVASS